MIFLAIQARTAPGRSDDWIAYCRQFLAGGPGELQIGPDVARIFFHPLADAVEIPLAGGETFEALVVTSGIGPGLHEECVAWLDGAVERELLADLTVDDSTKYWEARDRSILERMHVKLLRQIDEATQQECAGQPVQTSTGVMTADELEQQLDDLRAYRDLPKHFPWWSRERSGWLWYHVGCALLTEWQEDDSEGGSSPALEAADRALRRAWRRRVQPARCQELLALVAERRGDWSAARAALQQLLELRPGDAVLHAREGLALWHLDVPDLAWRCFDRAVQLDPTLDRAWFNRALAEARLGRPGDALVTLKQYLRQNPGDWEGRLEKATLLIEVDRSEAALDVLDELQEEQSGSLEIPYLRGKALRSLGRWHEAIEALESAQADDYDVLIERGEAYRSLGLNREALADFKQALALDPQRPEAFRNAALAWEAIGEPKRAEQYRRLAEQRGG